MRAKCWMRILPYILGISFFVLIYVASQEHIRQLLRASFPYQWISSSDQHQYQAKHHSQNGLAVQEKTPSVLPKLTHSSRHTIITPPKPQMEPSHIFTTPPMTEMEPHHILTTLPMIELESIESELTDNTTQQYPSVRGEMPLPVFHKKDFNKLPLWEFDDVYIQDTQRNHTTCRQSLWNSEDPSFKQTSIPNITLFMYKDQLNLSEWNRLSHFNNPFGFMDYKYKDVKAAVDLIPKPKEPLILPRGPDGCVRCAVVGTGGILNGSGMGKEIDAHDHVFRMNGAVTAGYEEDVGSKTTVYVHTAHSLTTSLKILKKYGFDNIPQDEGIKYVMIPEGIRDFEWLRGLLSRKSILKGYYRGQRPWSYYPGQFDENRFYVLHPDFLRYVRNRFLKSPALKRKYWAIVRPSNGAFTIFLALHTCDVVDVYGFMTEDWKKYSQYYIGKSKNSKVIFYLSHDYTMEMKTWKKLHNAKIIKLYERND